MEIIGYSERGIINSLFYEIKSNSNSLHLLNDFISLVFFIDSDINFHIRDATVLIEQSFSDFGDSDIVLLIDNNGYKQSVFIEAKVKTFQRRSWSIEKEFKRFDEVVKQKKVSSSNLFIQLYHKVRLFRELQNPGIPTLKNGIKFPKCSSKEYRKIGGNEVVLNAVKKIKQYTNDAFFVALVPDQTSNIKHFFRDQFIYYNPFEFQEWSYKNWGFVAWAKVEEFCERYKLSGTQNIFKFNEGQIY